MGNQNSKEVMVESDGEEGNPGSSASASHNSSPRASPDLVFSSQVHTSTPRDRPFLSKSTIISDPALTTHPRRISTSSIPHTSPLKPDLKEEIPESPDFKNETSTPGYKLALLAMRGSSTLPEPPSPMPTPSDLNTEKDIGDDMENISSIGEPSSAKTRRRRNRKDRRRKQLQQLSPNLGNDQDPNSSVFSNDNTTADPTPSKNRSSKKRKTGTPGSRSRRRKKVKHNHDEDNSAVDSIPFSSLAESLYTDRMRNGNVETDDNDSHAADDHEKSNESDREPSLSHRSIPNSNTNEVNHEPGSAIHSNAASDNEEEAERAQDDSTSRSENQANGFENVSDGNRSSAEVSHQEDQDRMVVDEDDSNDDEAENSEGASDDEQNKSVPISITPSAKSLSADAKTTSVDEHPPDDNVLPESPQTDDSRPKQNSTRKRVVKPTFYERLAERSANGTTTHQSSSIAGPSSSSGKKQPKISTMLKGKAEGSPELKTPSRNRSVSVKTPKSRPHELATGPFSDFELRNINQAVERWRDDHDLTQAQVNAFIQGNPKEVNSQEFWARIISVCPNRPRQKLINQCRRKFHNFVARGTWTEGQQDELKRVWEQHGNKYALIGKIINRHPEDVRDRIRNYVVCGDNRRSDPWTIDEEERLRSIITDALQVIREHRRGGKITTQEADEELIDWQRVSELMDRTRSRLQCIQKWKIINRHGVDRGSIDGDEVMSVEETIEKARREVDAMLDRDRFSIVKAVKACDVNADSRIPWTKVRSIHLENRWTRPIIMLAWYRLRHSVPDWGIMSVPELVIQLSKTYHKTHKLEFSSDVHYDVGAEYSEMERKVQKMLKVHRAPKTPNTVVKTDDDDSGDEGSSEEDEEAEEKAKEDESDEEEDEASQETGGIDQASQQEGGESDEVSDDEPKDEDTPMKDGTSGNSEGSVDLGNDVDHESVDRVPSVDAPSITKFAPRKVRRSQIRYSSSARIEGSHNRFQRKPRSVREVIDESSQEDQDQDANNDEELSSDTNASEVESIPARL